MTRPFDQLHDRLQRQHGEGLAPHLRVLRGLSEQLEVGPPSGALLRSVRRLAHQLRASCTRYGLEEIAETAAVTLSASDDGLPDALSALVRSLELHERTLAREDEVLVVTSRSGLAAALTQAHRHLRSAHGLARAVGKLDAELDAVVLDLDLPDGDGRDLLSIIGTRPSLSRLGIIVLGCADDATRMECFALGAHHCLPADASAATVAATVEAVLVQQQRHRAQATTDPLTGLLDRSGLQTAFSTAAAHARRAGSPLTLALLDLDHFKRVNDTFGHAAGDGVLTHVAQVLGGRLRASDITCRWGGEELVLVFPDTRPHEALTAIGDIRTTLRRGLHLRGGVEVPAITLSGGVVEVDPEDTLAAAVARADALMYRAKAAGRDRVLLAASPRSPASADPDGLGPAGLPVGEPAAAPGARQEA